MPKEIAYREAICIHCNYTWDYSGKLMYATCPSCQKKTPIEKKTEEGGN
jgi:hypothetical protein